MYPDSTKTEDDVKTAFVMADSFNDAQRKVEEGYKKEYEQAEIFAVSTANVDIII